MKTYTYISMVEYTLIYIYIHTHLHLSVCLNMYISMFEKHIGIYIYITAQTAARKGAWKVKIKNNFSGPEKLFFLWPVGRVSRNCNYALGSWKST